MQNHPVGKLTLYIITNKYNIGIVMPIVYFKGLHVDFLNHPDLHCLPMYPFRDWVNSVYILYWKPQFQLVGQTSICERSRP